MTTITATIELERPARTQAPQPARNSNDFWEHETPIGNSPRTEANDADGQSDFDTPEDTVPPTHHSVPSQLRPVTRRRQMTVLIASFFAVFLTIGINQSYGVFLAYYLSTGSDPEGQDPFLPASAAENKALLAFVGTLGAGLTWAGGIFVNPIMARVRDPRLITAVGAGLIAAGYLMASGCSQVWQLLMTQGLIYGIGSSLLYFPMLAAAPEYFDTHRGSAMGFILSGAGIGGLTFAPLTRVLLAKVGAAWSLRIIGAIAAVIGILNALATPESRSIARRPTMVNWNVLKRPTFILSAIGAMLQASGNFVPISFLPEFSTRLGYSVAFGASLLSILNAVNTVARIGTGFLADLVGRQNTLMVSVVASAAVCVLWLFAAAEERGSMLIAFAVSYGFFSGGKLTIPYVHRTC
jgi:MFS family permease